MAYTRIPWLQAGERLRLPAAAGSPRRTCLTLSRQARAATPWCSRAARPIRRRCPAGGRCATAPARRRSWGLARPDVVSQYSLQQNLSSGAMRARSSRAKKTAGEPTPSPRSRVSWPAREQPGRAAVQPVPDLPVRLQRRRGGPLRQCRAARWTPAARRAARAFAPGCAAAAKFTLTQFPRDGQWHHQVRPGLEGLALVATQVQHQASLDGSYTNKFQAADARAAGPRRFHPGNPAGHGAGQGGGTRQRGHARTGELAMVRKGQLRPRDRPGTRQRRHPEKAGGAGRVRSLPPTGTTATRCGSSWRRTCRPCQRSV